MKVIGLLLTVLLMVSGASAEKSRKPSKGDLENDLSQSELIATKTEELRGGKATMKQNCAAITERWKKQVSDEQRSSGGLNFACSKVFWVFKYSTTTQHSWSDGWDYMGPFALLIGDFTPVDAYHSGYYQLGVYCKPRSLREQQVLSLAASCRQNPVQECFNAELLNQMDSIEPVRHHDLGNVCK